MRILAIAAAAFRVASFLASEPGPYKISERLRARFPDTATVVLTGGGGYREMLPVDSVDDAVLLELEGFSAEIGRALRCSYCSSIWLVAVFALLDRRAPRIVDTVAAAGVIAAGLDARHLALDALELRLTAPLPGGDPADAAD